MIEPKSGSLQVSAGELLKRLSINYAESHLDKITRFNNAVELHILLNAERVLIKLPS